MIPLLVLVTTVQLLRIGLDSESNTIIAAKQGVGWSGL
jgi:hypothetical protein